MFDKIPAILDCQSEDFAELTRVAGLDPAHAYRGADLKGSDFSVSDLSGFDFSGCDLSAVVFEGARGLDTVVIDEKTVLSDEFRAAIDQAVRTAAAPHP